MSKHLSPINPYLGLRHFTEKNAELFFGREEHIAEMIQKLNNKHFLAVVGSSGSGKSSLVGAGLVPELLKEKNQQQHNIWHVARMHPGANPMQSLVKALVTTGLINEEDDQQIQQSMLDATVKRSSMGLLQAIQQARLQQKFLLIVDQFEELFRYSEQEQNKTDLANQFVALLLTAIKQNNTPVYVCITMRSDFFGDCARIHGLPEAINDGQYLVPRMTRKERKAAIVKPMEKVGCTISNRLVQRLLNELGETSADQLPTLQHALMRTFIHWQYHKPEDPAMDIPHYEAIGTISNALNKHAESIYMSFNDERKLETEQLFKQLTMRVDKHDIRFPTPCTKLLEVCEMDMPRLTEIIDRFSQQDIAFLMPPEADELSNEMILDISHESLMRIWKRLRQWVEEEAQAALTYRRILDSANQHKQGLTELLNGAGLAAVLTWQKNIRPNHTWAERYGGELDLVLHYIESSVTAEKERKAVLAKNEQYKPKFPNLLGQNDLLKNIIANIPYHVYWRDINMVYQGANEQYAQLVGMTAYSIIGKSDFDLPWDDDEAKQYQHGDKKIMDSGIPMMHIEQTLQSVDGKRRIIKDRIPLRDPGGEVNGLLCMFMDITDSEEATDKKVTEEELLQTDDILNQAYV